jgi:hypothetical protein
MIRDNKRTTTNMVLVLVLVLVLVGAKERKKS